MDIQKFLKPLKNSYYGLNSLFYIGKLWVASKIGSYNMALSGYEGLKYNMEKYTLNGNRDDPDELERESIKLFFDGVRTIIDAWFEKITESEFERKLNQLYDRYEALNDGYPVTTKRFKLEMAPSH